MCIQELSTCLQYDTPIKVINLNNRYMGMVRQWQEFAYEGRYSHSYVDALPGTVFERTGRIHTHYSQIAAATGRLNPIFAAVAAALMWSLP